MFKIVIVATALEKVSLPKDIVRQTLDMMEAFEARLASRIEYRQRTDAEFEAWRRDWFLGDVQKDMTHILLLDSLGVRAFVSYVPQTQDNEISLSNLFIRPTAQGDGRTFRQIISRFLSEVEVLPATKVQMSTDKRNARVQKLAEKIGFSEQEQTNLDIRYIIEKSKLLQYFSRMRRQNLPDRTDT